MEDMSIENLSLFEADEPLEITMDSLIDMRKNTLDVVRLDYVEAQTMTWQELFAGFDTLHAITYSSGISFVCQLLNQFETAEIIFGCEDVISYSLQEIMAYQSKLIERLRTSASKAKQNLIERIENNSLHLYVARTMLSHEKIYLLAAKDGRKRVVMGSANMSLTAFGGRQRENISYVDGDQAYDWYMGCYEELRENSTDQIVRESILCADAGDNLEELPISRTIRAKKAVIVEPIESQKEEVLFALDVKNLASKLAPSVPKPAKKDKGKILLSPDAVKKIRRQVVAEQTKEKELRTEYPQLEVHAQDGRVLLNDQEVELNPDAEDVRHDVELFLKYMDGYNKFHGDVSGMQRRYYEFANWFFCTPFMACMRDMAISYNQNT